MPKQLSEKELKEKFNKSVPKNHEMRCSLSKKIMFDHPVMISSGSTFDKENILEWFQNHDTCPKSGEKLKTKAFVENTTLKECIQTQLSEVKKYLSAQSEGFNQEMIVSPAHPFNLGQAASQYVRSIFGSFQPEAQNSLS